MELARDLLSCCPFICTFVYYPPVRFQLLVPGTSVSQSSESYPLERMIHVHLTCSLERVRVQVGTWDAALSGMLNCRVTWCRTVAVVICFILGLYKAQCPSASPDLTCAPGNATANISHRLLFTCSITCLLFLCSRAGTYAKEGPRIPLPCPL